MVFLSGGAPLALMLAQSAFIFANGIDLVQMFRRVGYGKWEFISIQMQFAVNYAAPIVYLRQVGRLSDKLAAMDQKYAEVAETLGMATELQSLKTLNAAL